MKLPHFLLDIRDGMKTFGTDIATLVNSVFLSIVYLLGVGLTSLVAKLVKKHFLSLKPQGKTYWKDTDTPLDEESFYKQF